MGTDPRLAVSGWQTAARPGPHHGARLALGTPEWIEVFAREGSWWILKPSIFTILYEYYIQILSFVNSDRRHVV